MRSSHAASAVSAAFDDPNLVGYGGLEPVVRLAERCGLHRLVSQSLRITGAANSGGANPAAKVMSVVAAMTAGADSIDDVDRLRHGGMGLLFGETRAPSTVGTFLRSFTHGHNRQLHKIHRAFLVNLAAATDLLVGADEGAFIDIDPTHVRVYGRTKQGAEYGRLKGKRTLHPMLSTIGTKHSTPVIGPMRLRRGKAADVRGAASFVAQAIATARQAGASGRLLVRADSKFYTAEVVAACRRGGAHFSLSTGINADITATISKIPDEDWADIDYPNPIEDPETGQLISKAQVARIAYTAFKSRRKRERADGWLMVRRVLRENAETTQGQGDLFHVYRYHPVFTDNPAPLVEAETCHRQHAIIEPQIADLKDSALAHLPSASFQANNASLAHPGRDGAQPYPCRGMRRVAVSRPRRNRHHPRPPRRGPGSHRPLRTPGSHASAPQLALAYRVAAPVRDCARPAPTGHLTDPTLTTSPTRTRSKPAYRARRVSHDQPSFTEAPITERRSV